MKRIFSKQYISAHAPSFAQQIYRDEKFSIPFKSRSEDSMLIFLRKHGFKIAGDKGFYFRVMDDGSVELETK